MSRLVRFARAAAEWPIEIVEGIIAFAMLLQGLWFASPFFQPATSVSAQIWQTPTVAVVLAVLHIVLSVPWLYALLKISWSKRRLVKRWIAFYAFILYLFYGFSGIIVNGLARPTWISTLAIAMVCGVAHLRLKWLIEHAGN